MAEDGTGAARSVDESLKQVGSRPEKKGNKVALKKNLRFAGKMRKPGDQVVLSVKQAKKLAELQYI